MKTSSRFTATLAALVIAAGSPILAQDQGRTRDARNPDVRPTQAQPQARSVDETTQRTDLTEGVHIASFQAEERSLRRYTGQQLWNTEGADLGTIRDFLVEAATGQVRYAVVSTGGFFGIRNSLRLVPMEALQINDDQRRISVEIQQARWLQIPPVNDRDYETEQVQINTGQHEQVVRQFGVEGRSQVRTDAPARDAEGRDAPALIRASVLSGKTVQTADQTVGKIENIIIDLERGTAAALLDTAGGFTGTHAKYLVPLNRLAYDFPAQNPISSDLTRADFDRARPSNYGMMADDTLAPRTSTAGPITPTGRDDSAHPPVRHTSDEPLAPITSTAGPITPTGRDSTSPAPVRGPSDTVDASAQAVRQTLKNDPDLAIENVHVTAETDGRIVLRGSVRNQAIKERIENLAKRAVPAGMIDSQITVAR